MVSTRVIDKVLNSHVWHLLLMLQIKVNGNDFHTFEHRIPVEFVRALHIKGDVTIKTINIIGVRLLISLFGWTLQQFLCLV